ncbi:hypothetical protein HT094_01125 [Shewanella sp. ZOR0012]|nr:hypothetical protein [Shewanella sp. ZOR0012]
MTDSAGATSTQNLTLNLTGSNDGAVIGGDISAATTEDSTQATRGRLTITDADDGEAHFVAQSNTAGTYGSFTLLDNGQWSYQLDNSKHEVQALKDGQQVTDTFTVTSADGGLHQVTVTITGKNDAAVITGEDHQTLTEDQNVSGGQLIAQGLLHASTPDAGGDQFTPLSDLPASSAISRWVRMAIGSTKPTTTAPPCRPWARTERHRELHRAQRRRYGPHPEPEHPGRRRDPARPFVQHRQHAQEQRVPVQTDRQRDRRQGCGQSGQRGSQLLRRQPPRGGCGWPCTGQWQQPGHVRLRHRPRSGGGLAEEPSGCAAGAGRAGGRLRAFYLHDSGDQGQLHYAGNVRYNVHNNTLGSVPIDGLPTPLSAAGAVPDVSDALTISVTDIRVDHAGQLQTSGQLGISDADAGESHFNARAEEVAGTYGSFSIDASGHWVYSVDNGQSAVQNLQAGAQLTTASW